jgi:hypothetical protein
MIQPGIRRTHSLWISGTAAARDAAALVPLAFARK